MWPELKFLSTAPSAHNGRIVARRMKYAPHFTLSSHLRAVYLAPRPLPTSSRVCRCLTHECQTGAGAPALGSNCRIGGKRRNTHLLRAGPRPSPLTLSHLPALCSGAPPLPSALHSLPSFPLWRERREFFSSTQTQKAKLCREKK